MLRIVNHPHIIKTYEVHELDSYIAIVHELIKGITLADYIKESPIRQINEYDAIEITHQLLLGLYYLHSNMLIHRDIKPTNIMLKEKGDIQTNRSNFFAAKYDVILVDFGLCTRGDDFSHDSFLHDRSGTVGYLAPELIKKEKGEFYDMRIDVYSVGIVFYEM